MKLGELFVQLTTKGDTKELNNTLQQLEKAHKLNVIDLDTKRKLKKASSEEEKQLILKNAEQKKSILNTKEAIASNKQHASSLRSIVTGFTALVAGATIAYHAIDRMINSLADANQKLINFNRQTGISLGTLNKYASASAAVNRNATIEGTAQSLQNVASNLYDIQMGRGDISPYQELAFVGGRAFNPANMSVEQVIENVRQAIKGVGDIQATNIITRMGFSPDDLMMLRMSREEFEKMQGLFLDPASREALNQYGLQLHIVSLQFQLMRDKILLKLMPTFIRLSQQLLRITTFWVDLVKAIKDSNFEANAVGKTFNALVDVFKALGVAIEATLMPFKMLFLFIEDVVGYALGWDSYIGEFFDKAPEVIDKIKSMFSDWKSGQGNLENYGNEDKNIVSRAYSGATGILKVTLFGNDEQRTEFLKEWTKINEEESKKERQAIINAINGIKNVLLAIFGHGKVGMDVNSNEKIASLIEGMQPQPLFNNVPTVNTNSQVTNNNGVNNMQMNNTFNIDGNQDTQRQVYNGNLLAYNAMIAQNGITP